jgi:hypothetical protein
MYVFHDIQSLPRDVSVRGISFCLSVKLVNGFVLLTASAQTLLRCLTGHIQLAGHSVPPPFLSPIYNAALRVGSQVVVLLSWCKGGRGALTCLSPRWWCLWDSRPLDTWPQAVGRPLLEWAASAWRRAGLPTEQQQRVTVPHSENMQWESQGEWTVGTDVRLMNWS